MTQCRSIERHRAMSGFVRCQLEAGHPDHVPHRAIEDSVIWGWDGKGGRAAWAICGDELGAEFPGVLCLKEPGHEKESRVWGPQPAHIHCYSTNQDPRHAGGGRPRMFQWIRRWRNENDQGDLALRVAEYDGGWRQLPPEEMPVPQGGSDSREEPPCPAPPDQLAPRRGGRALVPCAVGNEQPPTRQEAAMKRAT